MSILKVSTIKSTSGISTSTPEELSKGRAKVWWNYAQRTGPAITNSYNVTSVTDNATGQYIVNFSVTLDKPAGAVSTSYDADAFNNSYSDNANLYATNTTAQVMTPNIGVSGAAFGNLHDCDFNYGVIVD